jgi:DNA mismatch repair protein MutL
VGLANGEDLSLTPCKVFAAEISMGRVRLLSDELINQIAAGEVVERPASVVKELAENAVDAQATSVRVQLAEGGLSAITITDDGHGMSREDAVLSLARHATSKLLDADGLFHIVTKGFRGEAIPSIASVSRFTLTTSEPGAPVGTKLFIDGGSPPHIEDAAPLGGTRIDVLDLFFNVPARRKFLKRESTELTHCEEAIVRLALAHPSVSFSLEHGGRRLISSAATTDLRERIAELMGAEVLPHLLSIDERRLGVTITGFIASPEFTLPTARALYTFVNRRYVRDRGINSAVQRAFQDSLPPGRQPVTAIFIEVDPQAVDVNVHPQKLEVRFADPRSIQEALSAAIGRALKAAPWRQDAGQLQPEAVHAQYAMAVDRFLARATESSSAFVEPLPLPTADTTRAPFGTARPSLNEGPPPGYFSALRYVGELGKRFWLCEGPGGTLVVLDPRAIEERLALQALVERFDEGTTPEPGLFSTTVTFSTDEAAQVLARAEQFARVGLELDDFGQGAIAIRSAPPELAKVDLEALVRELVPVLPEGDDDDFFDALSLMAHRSVSLAWRQVSHDEVRSRLEALDQADFGLRPVRAQVVVHELPVLELEARATQAEKLPR